MTEKTVDEIEQEILTDFPTYAECVLKIQTLGGKLAPFKINPVQKVLLDIMADIESSGRLVRILVLKARREGISTLITGRNYWRTSTNFNRHAMVITHEPEATDFLFAMVKRYHIHCHKDFKPLDKYNNKKMLEFNDVAGTGGLDSAIRVGTAGKEDFGSGQLIHYLHLSEVAKWPANTASDLLTSILQTVPDLPDTEVIFESTGRGIGGEFYLRYWAARYQYDVYLDGGVVKFRCKINEDASPENKFASVFIPWYVFPDYQSNVPHDFKKTKEEEELVRLYGFTDRQLCWRRDAIENKCDGKLDKFKQEYPSNAREAFIASGMNVFDANQVEALRKASKPPKKRFEISTSNGALTDKADGRFKMWEDPKPGMGYVIGADVAEGLQEGDFSCAVVLEHQTGKQVAEWHGHIAPDLFADILMIIAKKYNMAWLVPERNNHGILVVTKLIDARYPRVFAEKQIEPPNIVRRRFGWLTTKKTKPAAIDSLVEDMREGSHGIVSADLFNEMLSFVQHDDGTLGAEEGMHDDRVMSIAMAKYAIKHNKLPRPRSFKARSEAENAVNGKPIASKRRPSASAWT